MTLSNLTLLRTFVLVLLICFPVVCQGRLSSSTTTSRNLDELLDESWVEEGGKYVLPLDRTKLGAGPDCPRTLTQYFSEMEHLYNSAESSGNFVQTGTTTRGKGRVFYGKRDFATSDFYTTYYQVDFTNINQQQKDFVQSLFTENKYSEVDATNKPGARRVLRNLTKQLGETSELVRTEFTVIPFFPLFDRELVFASAEKKWNNTCTQYASPSVSSNWIRKVLGDPQTQRDLDQSCILTRGQLIYPSGFRVCIAPSASSSMADNRYDVQVFQFVTFDIGGLLRPINDLALFQDQLQAAILREAQTMEDKVEALA